MMYTKPKKVRYVDMAIWIDANAYSDSCNHEQLFEYLYHLSKMLAFKRAFFQHQQQTEDFAMFCASKFFLRLTDERQNEVDDNGNPKLEKIKSILNYMKKTLYPTKVDFERENYIQDYAPIQGSSINFSPDFRCLLDESIDATHIAEFNCYLHDIIRTIRKYLGEIPYVSDKIMWNNIYISCLLSFLSSITLRKKSCYKLEKITNQLSVRPEYIDKLYQREREDCTILYHLNDSMRDYITVLVNGIRRVVAKDLSETLHQPVQTQACMKDLLMQSYSNDSEDYE